MVVASVGIQEGAFPVKTWREPAALEPEESKPLRRNNAGKSLSGPEIPGSRSTTLGSIIGQCAADSAWIDLDQPDAFFLRGLWCRVLKCQALLAHRHHLVLAPMGRKAFECVQA